MVVEVDVLVAKVCVQPTEFLMTLYIYNLYWPHPLNKISLFYADQTFRNCHIHHKYTRAQIYLLTYQVAVMTLKLTVVVF